MFVDEATVNVKSGAGGDGCVSFRREAHQPRGGPDGGVGGKGGHVYLVAREGMRTLLDFEYKNTYSAPGGQRGAGGERTGAGGDDIEIDVPPGTVVYDFETGQKLADLLIPGDRLLAARGGEGGRGNAAFKSSTRQAPKFAEKGEPGEERHLRLELRLLADVGIIGFPNVGKSTFIAHVSAARPKIAGYPFTTLQPNLGVVALDRDRRMVIADMPGLIEGAHEGTGLGHEFLRHVERTHVLIHMLDAAGVEGRDPLVDFETINRELRLYDERLAELPQIVALNKVDLPDGKDYGPMYADELEKDGWTTVLTSAITGEGCRELLEEVWSVLSQQEGFVHPETEREPKEFELPEPPERPTEVLKIAEHVYLVRGTEIERIMSRADTETFDGAEWLHEQLSRLGVLNELKRAGISEGDTVFLGQVETEYTSALDSP